MKSLETKTSLSKQNTFDINKIVRFNKGLFYKINTKTYFNKYLRTAFVNHIL
jgi:hypothetical protein